MEKFDVTKKESPSDLEKLRNRIKNFREGKVLKLELRMAEDLETVEEMRVQLKALTEHPKLSKAYKNEINMLRKSIDKMDKLRQVTLDTKMHMMKSSDNQ